MKIRIAFVGNSSSSSFIVIFPKKPESVEEVQKYMFNGKDGEINYSDHSITYRQISELVFKDIQKSELDRKELIEVFAERYYVDTFNNGFPYQIESGYDRDCFFGLDIITMEMLRKLAFEAQAEEDRFNKKIEMYINKKIPKVPYASITKDGKETRESKRYAEYLENKEKIRNSDNEIKILEDKQFVIDRKYRIKMKNLEKKLAKADLAAIMGKYKGCFIAHITYSDDTKKGCTMEHGGVFRNIPHIRISHH